MDKTELLNQLKRPFPPDKVHWRVVSDNIEDKKTGKLKWGDKPEGTIVAYIDARDVMRRLDELLPMRWQNRYSHADKEQYICEIGIEIDGEWLWRSNGAGATYVEAEKGGMSDAFKRAAVNWGIGQYLYKIPNVKVVLTQRGSNWIPSYKPDLPEWATPEGYDRLILKRKPYSEKDVHSLIQMIESEDAYGIFRLFQNLPEKSIGDMESELPNGKKTEYKRLMYALRDQGRGVMLETVTHLEELIDQDDGLGVFGVLEEETPKMIETLTRCMSPEHQDKLSIIQQEQAA